VSALKVVHKLRHNYLSISSQEVVHKPFVECGFHSIVIYIIDNDDTVPGESYTNNLLRQM